MLILRFCWSRQLCEESHSWYAVRIKLQALISKHLGQTPHVIMGIVAMPILRILICHGLVDMTLNLDPIEQVNYFCCFCNIVERSSLLRLSMCTLASRLRGFILQRVELPNVTILCCHRDGAQQDLRPMFCLPWMLGVMARIICLWQENCRFSCHRAKLQSASHDCLQKVFGQGPTLIGRLTLTCVPIL